MDNLAKINLSKDEKKEIKQYMESLLSYVEVLDEINTDGVYEKTTSFKNNTIKEISILRDDSDKNIN